MFAARFIPLLAVTVAAGCVGDVGSHEEARAAWLKTAAIMSDADAKIRGQAGAPAPAVSERAENAPYSADRTFACPREGTISVRGNYFVDAADGAFAGLDYEVEFSRCTIDSLRIDGLLDYAIELGDDGMTSTHVGELVWRGEVEGRCPIDMRDNPYSGTLCDFDAALALGG